MSEEHYVLRAIAGDSIGLGGTRYARGLHRISYPFCRPLASRIFRRRRWYEELRVVHGLAVEAYVGSAGQLPHDMFAVADLRSLVAASPNAWIVVQSGDEIAGYANVEVVKGARVQQILQGAADEGDIAKADIVPDSKGRATDYVHIGSFVLGADYRGELGLARRLLCGVAERVMDLSAPVTDTCMVFAINDQAVDGKRYAHQAMRRFGFQKCGTTKAGDPAWCLDLDSPNQEVGTLVKAIIRHRKESYLNRCSRWLGWSVVLFVCCALSAAWWIHLRQRDSTEPEMESIAAIVTGIGLFADLASISIAGRFFWLYRQIVDCLKGWQ